MLKDLRITWEWRWYINKYVSLVYPYDNNAQTVLDYNHTHAILFSVLCLPRVGLTVGPDDKQLHHSQIGSACCGRGGGLGKARGAQKSASPAFFVSSPPNPTSTQPKGEINRHAYTFKTKDVTRCHQTYEHGFFWDRAYQISDIIFCPKHNCVVNVTVEIPLLPMERETGNARKSPLDISQVTYSRPEGLAVYRSVRYVFSGPLPFPRNKAMFLWAKPLYWAAATWLSNTVS